MALAGVSAAGLTTLGALALTDATPRQIDVTVLWGAGGLTLGLTLTWVLIPRLPKWIVAGWGLILVGTGIGEIIAAPVPAGAGNFPWALAGLVVFGVVTILTAVIHRGAGPGDASLP
jgi:hypothetical protein